MQRVFREAEGADARQARETTQIGVECIGEAGRGRPTRRWWSLLARGARARRRARLQAGRWPRWACCARCCAAAVPHRAVAPSAVLRAYHASNFVDARPADLRVRRRAFRRCSPRPSRTLAAHPRRARGHRRGARAGGARWGARTGLDDLARTFDLLAEAGLADRILVDFSVMSSFDYYTGIVFEAYAPRAGHARWAAAAATTT